uniref:Uncharacterized protein n=1 Tax=Vespula pensylvanica TaxID=30213 RepID=A0A834UGT3_VESPE|nr:hypothetical protein H0235_001206 [Vespula pensylvanica]
MLITVKRESGKTLMRVFLWLVRRVSSFTGNADGNGDGYCFASAIKAAHKVQILRALSKDKKICHLIGEYESSCDRIPVREASKKKGGKKSDGITQRTSVRRARQGERRSMITFF